MVSTRTVEQTRIEGKTASNKSNQKTPASESTLPSWNTTASTGNTGLLKLVRESLPGLLGVHDRVDAVVPATKGSGAAVRQLPSCDRDPDYKESGAPTFSHPPGVDRYHAQRRVEQCGESWSPPSICSPPPDHLTVRLGLLGMLVSDSEP